MCLIILAYKFSERFPFVLAANRDEFHERPTSPMHIWDEGLLAGRDLRGGGTWMGFASGGRFAAITNYRDAIHENLKLPSRGDLVKSFLERNSTVEDFHARLRLEGHMYNGFNLIYGSMNDVHYYSNRGEAKLLGPGLYGLSNHLLDTPWPKLQRAKEKARGIMVSGFDQNSTLDLLHDEWRPADTELPQTGVSLEMERFLSSIFIRGTNYGTRCSTVAFSDESILDVREKSFSPQGISNDSSFKFDWNA